MKEYRIGDVNWLVCQALDETGRTTEDVCTECDADIPDGDESALCLDGGEVICLDCFRKELSQAGQSMRRNPLTMALCACGDYADCSSSKGGCGSCQEHCICAYQDNPYGPVDITLTRHEYFMLHRLDTSRSFVQQHLRGDFGKQEQEEYAMDYHRLQNRRLAVGFDLADPWASSFGLQLTVDGRKALAEYRASMLPVKSERPTRQGLRRGRETGRQQINPCEEKSACDIYFAPDRNPALYVGSTPAARIWRCASCRKVNAWNWQDAENASQRLKEEVKVSHGSSYDNICGHCGTDFVKRNSPIRASVYTHEPRYRRHNPGFYF